MCEYIDPPNVEEVSTYNAPENTDIEYDEDSNTITVYAEPDKDDGDDVPDDPVGDVMDTVSDILGPIAEALSNRSRDDDDEDEEESDSDSSDD